MVRYLRKVPSWVFPSHSSDFPGPRHNICRPKFFWPIPLSILPSPQTPKLVQVDNSSPDPFFHQQVSSVFPFRRQLSPLLNTARRLEYLSLVPSRPLRRPKIVVFPLSHPPSPSDISSSVKESTTTVLRNPVNGPNRP